MEERYITLRGEGFGRLVEQRSEFLAYAAHVENEAQALDYLAKIRKKHADARHNVYACLLGNGGVMRCSDDGEPHGTAGLPVLDVIRKGGFTDGIIVVARYFGGILLGTGGLVRAYSAAARLAVEDAGTAEFIPFDEILFSVDYSLWQRVSYELPAYSCVQDSVEYGADVRVRAALPKGRTDAFLDRLRELSAGRAMAVRIGERRGAIPADGTKM